MILFIILSFFLGALSRIFIEHIKDKKLQKLIKNSDVLKQFFIQEVFNMNVIISDELIADMFSAIVFPAFKCALMFALAYVVISVFMTLAFYNKENKTILQVVVL